MKPFIALKGMVIKMTTIKLCGIAIVAVVFIMTIKQFRPEYATVLTVITCVVLFTCVIGCLAPVTDMLDYITDEAASGKFSDFYAIHTDSDEISRDRFDYSKYSRYLPGFRGGFNC